MRSYLRCPIIVTSFDAPRHDVSSGRCSHGEFPSVLDLLEVKEDAVFNCLVDQNRAEQVLVLPTNAEAQKLLGHSGAVPKNCHFAVTCEGYQYFPAPNYRSYFVHGTAASGGGGRNDNHRVLSVSAKEVIEGLQREAQDIRLSLERLGPKNQVNKQFLMDFKSFFQKDRVSIQELQDQRKELDNQLAKSEREIAEHQHQIRSKNVRKGELLNEAATEKPPSVEALEDDLDVVKEEMAKVEEKRDEARERVGLAEREAQRAKVRAHRTEFIRMMGS